MIPSAKENICILENKKIYVLCYKNKNIANNIFILLSLKSFVEVNFSHGQTDVYRCPNGKHMCLKSFPHNKKN